MSNARAYLATAAILGAVATSGALLAANEILVPHHYNLRGLVLVTRLLAAVVLAVPMSLPWAAVAVWALSGKDRTEQFGAAAFASMMSAPGAYSLLDIANVALDDSEPRIHVVRFVESVTERKGSGYSRITSWRDPGETVGLTRNLAWGGLKPGDALEIVVHDGALRWEYIGSFRPVAAPR